MGGWWRWALVSPDGVAPSQMVSVSATVNLPLHHKVQKFSSGTCSPGCSRKKGCKTVVCVCVLFPIIMSFMLCFLQCLVTVGWLTGTAYNPKKPVPHPKESVPVQNRWRNSQLRGNRVIQLHLEITGGDNCALQHLPRNAYQCNDFHTAFWPEILSTVSVFWFGERKGTHKPQRLGSLLADPA